MTGRADPGQRAAIREMKARRASKHLTQPELAHESGVPLRTIQRLESGKGWAQPLTLSKLEKALSWPPGYMDERAAQYNDELARRTDGVEPAQIDEIRRHLSAMWDALGDDSKGSALPGG